MENELSRAELIKKMARDLREDVIRLYGGGKGLKQAEIARRLKVSRQWVSQIIKEAGL